MDIMEYLQAFVALIAIIGAIFMIRPFLRRFEQRTKNTPLFQIQGALSVDRARKLTLVQCEDQKLLMLTGGGQDFLLPWPPKNSGEGK